MIYQIDSIKRARQIRRLSRQGSDWKLKGDEFLKDQH